MKEYFSKNKVKIMIFCIYAVLTFALLLLHEDWRDEAQAWLIARDLNPIEMVKQMKYEGHFLLWYFILMPFAKLGFPYITTNIISWLITCLAAWLILDKAPFEIHKKTLFIFTFPMLYLFPVISRCYCLIPLAVVLMAMFYENRKKKPIRYILAIIFLMNTHIIMLGMVGILLLDFYIEQFQARKSNTKEENKKWIISIIISIVLGILSILPLFGSVSTNQLIRDVDGSFLYKIVDMFLKEPIKMLFNNYYTCNLSLIAIFAVVFLMGEVVRYRKYALEIGFSLLWQYGIFTFVYAAVSLQRSATGIFILFFFYWIQKDKKPDNTNTALKKGMDIALIFLVIFNICAGLKYICKDIKGNYSAAYQVGEYICENLGTDSLFVTGGKPEFTSAIIPYVDKNIKFYHLQREDYFSFTTWDEKYGLFLEKEMFEKFSQKFADKDNMYYIFTKSNLIREYDEEIVEELVKQHKLEQVFETQSDFYAKERYIVYKINLNGS